MVVLRHFFVAEVSRRLNCEQKNISTKKLNTCLPYVPNYYEVQLRSFFLIVFFLSTVEKQDEIGSTNLCFNTPIKLEEPKSTISHCHLEKIEEKIESLI